MNMGWSILRHTDDERSAVHITSLHVSYSQLAAAWMMERCKRMCSWHAPQAWSRAGCARFVSVPTAVRDKCWVWHYSCCTGLRHGCKFADTRLRHVNTSRRHACHHGVPSKLQQAACRQHSRQTVMRWTDWALGTASHNTCW